MIDSNKYNEQQSNSLPTTLEEAGFVDYKTRFSDSEDTEVLKSKVRVEKTDDVTEVFEFKDENLKNMSDREIKNRQRQERPSYKKQVYEPSIAEEGIHNRRIPKYVEAWGFAVASARFRGLIVILLSVSLLASSMTLFVTNLMLSGREYFVVGLDGEGRPTMLEQTSLSIKGPEVFIRDFVAYFMNYSPPTVDNNVKKALSFSTNDFASQWNSRFGSSWISTVKRERIVQTVAVNRIEISTMESKQFTATVWTVRYRSSDSEKNVIQDQVKYDLSVYVTTPSSENPWGYYVQAMTEGRY